MSSDLLPALHAEALHTVLALPTDLVVAALCTILRFFLGTPRRRYPPLKAGFRLRSCRPRKHPSSTGRFRNRRCGECKREFETALAAYWAARRRWPKAKTKRGGARWRLQMVGAIKSALGTKWARFRPRPVASDGRRCSSARFSLMDGTRREAEEGLGR